MYVLTVMGTYDMSQFLFIFLLLVVFPCTVWGISSFFSKNKGEMTAHVTVKSRRVERHSTWNYLVCFELSDGSELELLTTKGDHQTLKDGQSGQVTWENGHLYHFDPDTPQ